MINDILTREISRTLHLCMEQVEKYVGVSESNVVVVVDIIVQYVSSRIGEVAVLLEMFRT